MTHHALPALNTPGVVWGLPPARAALQMSGLVYLATPYSKRVLMDGRFSWKLADDCAREALGVCAVFERLGVTAISPILNAHYIVRRHGSDWGPLPAEALALDADHWTRWCAPLLAACRSVYVPALDGWDHSAGVAFEVQESLSRNRPVIFEGVLQ